MKKTLAMIALLLVAALLLVSCGSKENKENKEFTAKDIEGRWTVSESSTAPAGELTGLAGFLMSARSNVNGIVVFKDGKITVECEEQDGKKTYELGAYEVSEGKVFINGFMTEPKLEDKTLTLTELPKPTQEEESEQEITEATMTEVTGEGTVMILEKK